MKKSTKIISLIMMVILLLNSSMVGVFALSPTYTPSASYKNSEYYRKLCAVNLTGNQVDDIISVALSQEGYYESNSAEQLSGANLGSGTYNNYTEYGAWFGKGKNGTTGWCAIFISWCAAQAQVPTSVIEKTANATAQSFCNNYYDFGEITPQKGDILALHKTDPEHVGLIYDVDDNFIYAIEGNMRSGGTRVSKVKYIKSSGKRTWDNGKSDDGKQIVRIARPDYSKNVSTPSVGDPDVVDNTLYSTTCRVKDCKNLLTYDHSQKINFIGNTNIPIPEKDRVSVKVQGRNMQITIQSESIKDGKIYLKESGGIDYANIMFTIFINDFIDTHGFAGDGYKKHEYQSDEHSFVFKMESMEPKFAKKYVDLSKIDYYFGYLTDKERIDNPFSVSTIFENDGGSEAKYNAFDDYTENGVNISYSGNTISFSFIIPKGAWHYENGERIYDSKYTFNNENLSTSVHYWELGLTPETDTNNDSTNNEAQNEQTFFERFTAPIINFFNSIQAFIVTTIDTIRKAFSALFSN